VVSRALLGREPCIDASSCTFRHDGILLPLIDNYEKDGTYTKEFAEEARKNAKAHHDGKQVGKVLLRVLGVA
jgi:hypothetical protein